ncbi:hypothetical protein IWW35_001207 [Coemansia sp. RSA 1878]|nr:hypothetical protein IWW35_001207 [Coemansia sp. RSA 1878]
MAAIDALTGDILQCIFRIVTADAHKCLRYWKHALPVLAICRRWRELTIHLVYSTVIIGDGPVIESSYMPVDVCTSSDIGTRNQNTNMDLLLSTGYIKHSRELVITQTPTEYPIQLLVFIKHALDNFCEWTGIRVLRLSFCTTIYNYELHSENDHEDNARAAQIAQDIAEVLCNVDTLAIRTMLDNEMLIKFAETLGRCYFGQLKDVWWMTPACIGSDCTSTRLTTCLLRHANNEQSMPLVRPQQLKSMRLVPYTNKFSWQCFHFDKQSNNIVFENLTNLSLESRHYGIRVPDDTPILLENELNISFPSLRHLSLICVNITPDIIQLFAASPLTTVVFEGLLENALHLQALNLNRLSMLKVSTWFGCTISDEKFCTESNALFQSIECAVVVFSVDIDDMAISATDVYWPCLTHLELCSEYIEDLALDLVPRVPNLVYLFVRAFKAGKDETEQSAQEYFECLRQKYSQPSQSNITNVVLSFATGRPKSFDDLATDLFVHYLPKLWNIKLDNVV